ncbi:YfbM family protein (plasmid) [Streptomyces virginiae]|uniref:DUF1877 family protein n=1 Tax=Streptomyces virginiae TaxID=1961 RepID=UPI002F90C2E8
MIGQYLRLTPAELERASLDPDWAAEYAHELYDRDDAAADARVHETDKASHALDFLLKRRGFPVDVVFGEADMPWPEGEDWGYGPPRPHRGPGTRRRGRPGGPRSRHPDRRCHPGRPGCRERLRPRGSIRTWLAVRNDLAR